MSKRIYKPRPTASGPRKKLDARNEKIVSMYKEGMTIQKIAETMKLSKTSIGGIIISANGKPFVGRDMRYTKIVDLYKNGNDMNKIAEIMNLTRERIRQILYKTDAYVKREIIFRGDMKKLIKNIHHDILEGLSHSELAEKYKYQISTLKRLINKFHLPKPSIVAIQNRNKLIIEAIKNGKPADEVAAEFKLYTPYVYQICRENGFHYKHLIRERVKELSKKGLSVKLIASELKITSQAVSYHLGRFKKQKDK
jgi:DNA-binding CsgD family transcriptional regulator